MHITLFGQTSEAGFPAEWTRESIFSLSGDVNLDLTKRPPAPGARLTIFHVFGGNRIRIPSGRRLSVGGLTLFGGRRVDVAPATGPDLQISIYVLLGGVEITEAEAAAPTPV